jgi:hypothetical protein
MSLAQILRKVAPEEQHDVQSRRNSGVSYHVNMALCVICDEGITVLQKYLPPRPSSGLYVLAAAYVPSAYLVRNILST